MLGNLLRPLAVGALAVVSLTPSLAQVVVAPPGAPGQVGQLGRPLMIGGGMEGPRLRQLITRPDVQRGLELNLTQQNEIKELFADPNNGRVAVRLEATGATDPESLRKQAEEQIRAQQGSVEDKVKKILKPNQWDRFVELDLQWRGPLALATPKAAERLKIDNAHRAQIGQIATEYNMEKQDVMMKLAERNDDGNGRVMVRINTKALDNPQLPEVKQLKKAKEAAEKKILAVLSAEEKERWNKALGEPFSFRTDLPGNRF
jgi:hypothetical protein